MTAVESHSLAWERTPPGATIAMLVVATGLAVTGALQFPVAQRVERTTSAPHVAPTSAGRPPLASGASFDAPPAAAAGADGDAGDASVAVAPPEAIAPPAVAAPAITAPAGPIDPRCPPRWTIRFRRGSWSPPPRLSPHFAGLRGFLARNPRASVLVLGYADPVGNDRDNQALSVRRASAVAASIRHAGVQAAKVTVGGIGAFTVEEAGAADSDALRRVEVRVRGVAPCAGVSEEVVDP